MNNNIYKIAILILSLIFVIALLSSCYSASDSEKSFTLSPTGTTKEEHFIPATSYPSNPSVTSYRYPVPTYQDTPLLNSESGQPEKVTFEGTGIIIGELFSATNKTGIPKTMFFLIKALDDERHSVPTIITGPGNADPIFYTNEEGCFTVYGVEPGFYYLVMAAPPYDWAIGYQDNNNLEPLLIEVKPNETVSLGRILIYWP